MKCPNCGYEDPFLRSWFDMEKEVCDHEHAMEWDRELFDELSGHDVRRIEKSGEEYVYHKTPKSVERWRAWDWDHRKSRKAPYYEATRERKNYHLIGRQMVLKKRRKK